MDLVKTVYGVKRLWFDSLVNVSFYVNLRFYVLLVLIYAVLVNLFRTGILPLTTLPFPSAPPQTPNMPVKYHDTISLSSFPLSGIKCKGGAIYDDCGPACRLTCRNKDDVNKVCTKPCVAGCQCPAGKVWHKRKCISPSKCAK